MKNKVLQLLLLGMFAFLSSNAFAQLKVGGVVKSSDGEVLPGATIVVKGSTNGVLSDMDGKYSITVPNAQSTLIFTFVGMQSQEVAVNGRTAINVTLESTSIGVDEVVVTALGISREKKSLGYSVGEVKGESLQKVAQENVLNSLAGKVAGVAISSTGEIGRAHV